MEAGVPGGGGSWELQARSLRGGLHNMSTWAGSRPGGSLRLWSRGRGRGSWACHPALTSSCPVTPLGGRTEPGRGPCREAEGLADTLISKLLEQISH